MEVMILPYSNVTLHPPVPAIPLCGEVIRLALGETMSGDGSYGWPRVADLGPAFPLTDWCSLLTLSGKRSYPLWRAGSGLEEAEGQPLEARLMWGLRQPG